MNNVEREVGNKMTIDSNQDNKNEIKESNTIYTAEEFSENLDERWDLFYVSTDKKKVIEVATNKINIYFEGDARIRTWVNGEVIETEYVRMRSE